MLELAVAVAESALYRRVAGTSVAQAMVLGVATNGMSNFAGLALPARANVLGFPPSCSAVVRIPECATSDDCPPERPFCDETDDGSCVECQSDSDCAEGAVCARVEFDSTRACLLLCPDDDACQAGQMCVQDDSGTTCITPDGGVAARAEGGAPTSTIACLVGTLTLLFRRRRREVPCV